MIHNTGLVATLAILAVAIVIGIKIIFSAFRMTRRIFALLMSVVVLPVGWSVAANIITPRLSKATVIAHQISATFGQHVTDIHVADDKKSANAVVDGRKVTIGLQKQADGSYKTTGTTLAP